jgi:large subunit ribosomal protein L7/L12
MAQRIESIAIGACRRLGRTRSHARGPPRCDASTSATSHPRPQTTSSFPRIRPATAASSGGGALGGGGRREFHPASIARDDAAPAAAAAAATPKTGEPIAPFASPRVEALFQKIIWLDMVEVHLLAELINEKLGITISDAERERIARGGGGGGRRRVADEDEALTEAVVEKTAFDLKLIGFDAKNKIKVIKEVRSMTSLGLKEAKELVEGVPATLKKGIKKEEAEELKVLLEGLGAQVDIV